VITLIPPIPNDLLDKD